MSLPYDEEAETRRVLPKASWLPKSRAAPEPHSRTSRFSRRVGFKDMKSEIRICLSLELWEPLVTKERPFRDPASLHQTRQSTAVFLGLPGHPPGCLKPSYVPMHSSMEQIFIEQLLCARPCALHCRHSRLPLLCRRSLSGL